MSQCVVCNKQLKADPLNCGHCHSDVCKSCAEFLSEESFKYADPKPINENNKCFCKTCFNLEISPLLNDYEEMLSKAHDVRVFTKSQSKETRLIKRVAEPIKIQNGLDEQDVLLRMAFKTAVLNYNSIVDVDIKSTKVRSGSYQTSTWAGTGIPAQVDDSKLVKDRSIRDNPN